MLCLSSGPSDTHYLGQALSRRPDLGWKRWPHSHGRRPRVGADLPKGPGSCSQLPARGLSAPPLSLSWASLLLPLTQVFPGSCHYWTLLPWSGNICNVRVEGIKLDHILCYCVLVFSPPSFVGRYWGRNLGSAQLYPQPFLVFNFEIESH